MVCCFGCLIGWWLVVVYFVAVWGFVWLLVWVDLMVFGLFAMVLIFVLVAAMLSVCLVVVWSWLLRCN